MDIAPNGVCPDAEVGSGLSGLQGLYDARGYRGTVRNTRAALALVLFALTTKPILPASAAVLGSSRKIGTSGM